MTAPVRNILDDGSIINRSYVFRLWSMFTDCDRRLLSGAILCERPLLWLKVRSVRPLVLLMWVVLRWRWLWSIGEVLMTGENRNIERKICPTYILPITILTRIELWPPRWEASRWLPKPWHCLWRPEIRASYMWKYGLYHTESVPFSIVLPIR
jgi:hypothetical protein